MNNLKAEDIAEDLLCATGKALSNGDLDGIGSYFEVPQVMETLAGKRLVETEEDVRQVFEAIIGYFEENGITDVVRTVISSEFLSENVIGSTHVSQLMRSDGSPYHAPYPSYSVLRKTEGKWRISSSIYAIVDNPEHVAALAGNVRKIPERS